MTSTLLLLTDYHGPDRTDIRLLEWISRRGQQHCDCSLNPRTFAQARRAVGSILQFCGRFLSWYSRGQNHWTRNDSSLLGHAVCGDRRASRSNRLGPSHVVVGIAHILLPRLDRWLCRGRCHALWAGRNPPWRLD